VDFQKEFWSSDALKHEYATKYLQQIGAELTPDNIQTVLKNVPLENCKCTPAWKSRGWLADCIYIHPNPNKKKDKEREKQTKAKESSGPTISSLLRKDADESAGEPSKSSESRRAGRRGKYGKQSPEAASIETAKPTKVSEEDKAYDYNGIKQDFDAIKKKHMFPYNLKGREQRKAKLATDPPPLASRLAKASTQKSAGDAADATNRLQRQDDVDQALEEVKRPLQVTLEDIENMQTEFLKAMPFQLLKTHVTQEQKEALRLVLITSTMKRLIGLVSHYLYWTVLRTHLPASENAQMLSEEDRQTVYLAIAGTFNEVEMQLKKRRHDVVFQLPLVLLSVKVGIETVFRDAYPTWFKLEEEEHGVGKSVTLSKFNSVITRLFDPDNYNSHVSALESTTEAMRIASRSRHQHTRKKPQRLRDQYYTTSTQMQKLFPRPAAGEARRLLVERGGEGGGRGPRSRPSQPRPARTRTRPVSESSGLDRNNLRSDSVSSVNSVSSVGDALGSAGAQFLTAENRSKLLQLTLKKAQSRYTDSTNRKMKEREGLLASGNRRSQSQQGSVSRRSES